MHWAVSVLFILHGVAHLPGFLVDWKLWQSSEMPYRTTLFAGVLEVGDAGTRVLGAAWLAACLCCIATGAYMAVRPCFGLAWAAVALSTMLCVLGLPDSRLGLVTNAILAVGLIIL